MDGHADPEIASTSERGAEWLNRARETLLDELARQLSLVLGRRQPDRPTLEAAITAGAAARWPVEVLSFWVAALRLRGASWDDIGSLLGTSRQAAHHRFAPWTQRYLPLVTKTTPGSRPMPANQAETRAPPRKSTDLGSDHLDTLHQEIARAPRGGLDVIAEQPP